MAALPPVPGSGSSPSSPPPRKEDIVGNPTSADVPYAAEPSQQRWVDAGYAIIQEIALERDISNWQELFEGLATKRHDLARALGQRVKGPSVEHDGNDFGILRSIREDVIRKEIIFLEGPWKASYPECRDLAIEYAKFSFRKSFASEGEPLSGIVTIHFDIFDILSDATDEDEAQLAETFGREQITPFLDLLKSPDSDEQAILNQIIILLDSLKKSDQPFPIKVLYPSGYFAQAVLKRDRTPTSHPDCGERTDPIAYRDEIDAAYADLLKPENSLQEFRYKAAKFYYLMVRLLPCHRGTSSVIDWMVRGIAIKKGYALGQYNHQALGWDLKALLTPPEKLEEYCQWFRDQAFA